MVIVLLYYNISLRELPWENKVFISIIRANPACRVWLVFSPSNWFVLTLTLLYIRLEMLRDYILYPLFCVWLFYNILSRTILMVVLLVFLFHCHASVLAWSILETNLWRRTVLHNIRFNVGKMTSTISLHPPPKFKITQTRQLVLSFQNVLYYCPFKTRNKTFSFKQELTAHFRGTHCKSVTTCWNDSSQFKICCIFRSWQQDYRTILACQTLIVLIVWQHWLNFNCLP